MTNNVVSLAEYRADYLAREDRVLTLIHGKDWRAKRAASMANHPSNRKAVTK